MVKKIMIKRKTMVLLMGLLGFSTPLQAFEQRVVQIEDMEFWTENFGRKEAPAILLIMGSGSQGLLWHQDFCEKLANEGYFVIRFDHRDVGLSSVVDYDKNPYTLLHMAKDAIAILDAYQIQKAHLVGNSMGGSIAMIMGAHFPQRVNSLSIMASTSDMRANLDAIQGRPTKSPLSAPRQDFLDWIKTYVSNPPKTLAERVEKYLEGARLQNGRLSAADEELNKQLALQSFIRTKNPASMFNHLKALEASYELYSNAAGKIKAPTLILHGDQDPIFLPDHGEALKNAIPQSQLAMIPGMGHGLNPHLYSVVIEKIMSIAKKSRII